MEYIDVSLDYASKLGEVTGFTQSFETLKPVAVHGLALAADFLAPGLAETSLPVLPSATEALGALATVVVTLATCAFVGHVIAKNTFLGSERPLSYVVDVATYKSFAPEWKMSSEDWLSRATTSFNIAKENVEWCRKVLARSGVGDETHFPPGVAMSPPDLSIAAARYEAELVMFDCVDQLLQRNKVNPRDIDVLVVNCSIFNPTPSLAAMVINHYKLRDDVVVYNLSGLGCSASPIAVHLAGELLQGLPKRDPLAIVISTENITQNIYRGKDKSMLVANVLFRMGGAAVLLAKHPRAVGRRPAARYAVTHMVRVHLGADEEAYRSVFQDADREGQVGVRLDKNLMQVARRGLERNLRILAPQVLPLHEKLRYALREGLRRWKVYRDPSLARLLPVVVPDLRTAVDHFAIHAGGRAVIDAVQEALGLSEADVASSRTVLREMGNVSSASVWYEVQDIEATRRPRRGDTVCLLAFGSGMKFNSLVMRKL